MLDRSFWSALPSLFEARCRLPTSANCVSTTCGREPELCSPRRDGGQDLLPFLTRHRLLPCGSGDARRAALRPVDRTPPPVSSPLRGFARRRCSTDRATYDVLVKGPPQCSDDRRARVEGPSEGRVFLNLEWRFLSALATSACVWLSHADDVPLLGVLRTSVVAGACVRTGRVPLRTTTDRPRPAFRRHPAKGTDIRQAGMPFTVTSVPSVRRITPPRGTRRPPAHAAQHVFPKLGTTMLFGHCKRHGAVTR